MGGNITKEEIQEKTELMEESPAKNTIVFTPLTPINNVDLGVYKDAFDFAFSNNEVKNIAVSGAYGSGKSSILSTYEKQINTKFLHISLAHFELNDDINKNNKVKNKEEDEKNITATSVLEWKILNQLIHQINPAKIPQTNFNVKKNTSKFRLLLFSISVLFFISSLLHTILFYKWVGFTDTITIDWLRFVLRLTTFPEFRLITLFIGIILAVLGFFKILVLQRNRHIIKKLDVKGTEIEMFKDSDDSYFDKYLNEVLYLFENSEQNVIVFEDIDRYGGNAIFERLREINTLINYSRKPNKSQRLFIWLNKRKNKFVHWVLKKTGKKEYKFPPMRFLYLLKDDIFTNKDRTKFFDLIIPVVPIIDGSNSYDKFIEVFNNHGIKEHFTSEFLQGFSLYIDEMRLLLNICNEYEIYYQKLGTTGTEIDCNKLLAIIAYKNLFPSDFAALQLKYGFVFTLISFKDTLITEEQTRLSNEIDLIKTKIEKAQNEHLQFEQEVDKVYEDELQQAKDSFNNRYYSSRNDRDEAQKKIDEINQEIADRKENIKNKTEEKQDLLTKEIIRLERELIELRSKRLKELLSHGNLEDIFKSVKYTNPLGNEDDFEDVKDNSYFTLLIFLIRNGYIDETYQDYMTYFYPNSLSARDVAFCRSVTDQNAKPPDYTIDNPATVVDRLPVSYYRQPEVLNYAVLDFLLEHKNASEQLKLILIQLEEHKLYDFIRGYFANGEQLKRFIPMINNRWNSLFSELLLHHILGNEQLDDYARYTICHSTNKSINVVNIDSCLTTYISQRPVFLNVNTEYVERLINGFKLLNVSFAAIDAENVQLELLRGIYKNKLFDITFENISIMLTKFYVLEKNPDFIHKNYSLICKKLDSPLATFINENINDYIKIYISHCENEINDEETVARDILNNKNLQTELKQQYITVLKTPLTALSDITDKSLWTDLLKSNDAITYSEKNVIDYFFSIEGEFNDTLINWINNQSLVLNYSWDSHFSAEDNKRGSFFDAVVKCNELTNARYKEYVVTSLHIYDKFPFTDINKDKMDTLIANNIIKMNVDNLIFIRDNYSFDVVYRFAIQDIDEYIKILAEQADDLFNVSEAEYIISTKSGVIEKKQLSLLALTNAKFSIKNKSYSESIQLYILNNNFSEDDFEMLIKNYNSLSKKIRVEVIRLLTNRIDKTIEFRYPISKLLFDDLVNVQQLTTEQITRILILALANIGERLCSEYLLKYGLGRFIDIFDKNKKPQFDNSEFNKFALDSFIQWGKIKEYNIGENGKIHIKRSLFGK